MSRFVEVGQPRRRVEHEADDSLLRQVAADRDCVWCAGRGRFSSNGIVCWCDCVVRRAGQLRAATRPPGGAV